MNRRSLFKSLAGAVAALASTKGIASASDVQTVTGIQMDTLSFDVGSARLSAIPAVGPDSSVELPGLISMNFNTQNTMFHSGAIQFGHVNPAAFEVLTGGPFRMEPVELDEKEFKLGWDHGYAQAWKEAQEQHEEQDRSVVESYDGSPVFLDLTEVDGVQALQFTPLEAKGYDVAYGIGYDVKDSYVDEDGVTVISDIRLHSISAVLPGPFDETYSYPGKKS